MDHGPVAEMVQMTAGTAATLQGVFVTQFFKYFVYRDSAWSYVGYDLARAGRDGAKVDAVISAVNPDLSAFRARGGKLCWCTAGPTPRSARAPRSSNFKAVSGARRRPRRSRGCS
jgi:hypothetical protein